MCGICGLSWQDVALCRVMADILKHRGPDDEGFYFDDKVSLGHRRLSIIDLELGHQPIHNEDKSVWIVYNGEIYNFKEVREDLEKDHIFHTNSDTEVIVHAYEEFGLDCVKVFRGMWAFCIYDKNKNILFLSRDRFGIKPLYYHFDGKRFVFASEIKALLAYVKAQPNDETIYDFMVKGSLEHKEDTFFSGIKRVFPSTNLIYNIGTEELRKEKYWDIKTAGSEIESSSLDDEQYAKKFYNIFVDSVKTHLISEVPLGTCLSGGLDSSSIVCVANSILLSKPHEQVAKAIGERQKTFSAVYIEKDIDEREYIKKVIEKTNAEENHVFPSGKGLFNEIENIVYYQDEPFPSTSPYAQWKVMNLASSKVKVLLDGQGGDELLAGYVTHFRIYFSQLLRERRLLTLIKEIVKSSDIIFKHPIARLRIEIMNRLHLRARAMTSVLSKDFLDSFFSKSGPKTKKTNDVASASYDDLLNGHVQSLLRYEDRNSMAFSVEARVPFLDHRLIEYVFSLPANQRIKNGWTKYVLRNAMRNVLPEEIRTRRDKIGFATPEKKWLIENKEKINEILKSQSFMRRKYFDQKEVMRRFNEFFNGREHDTSVFWKIICLEIWLRVFVDQDTRRNV